MSCGSTLASIKTINNRPCLSASKCIVSQVQVHREGKVLGQLLLGLKAMHQRALIGRDATPGACDVVLEHASVSRRHAHLTADSAGGISLIDLGSGALPLLWLWVSRVWSPAFLAAVDGRHHGPCQMLACHTRLMWCHSQVQIQIQIQIPASFSQGSTLGRLSVVSL